MTEPYVIPPEFEPDPAQIPAYAKDVDRFRICFAITLQIAQRVDPLFCRQLYFSDELATGEELAPPPWANGES
jgi:hypothetical protein